ncbi:MAG TPA: pyrroline-5-carboxylate reductase [Burkholderiaceae bacterium]|nr:pyrroline-5-carboxylate reductase [Burkholderiaceae bacterium]
MNHELTIAFIGGGNMATALGSGLIGKRCGAHDVHVIDINPDALQSWAQQGCSTATAPDETLSTRRVWVLAVKPQYMKETVAGLRPYLKPDTLVVSIAAGISAETLGLWLGSPEAPWTRLVRCMPNTPALIAAGATGLMAGAGVSDDERVQVQTLFKAVGEVVWVEDDHAIDVVTSLSGSGPAYVFLFLEAMIAAAVEQGMAPDTARRLAIATVTGATQLAALSPEDLATLRERVTSRGGTTAAALNVFRERDFTGTVRAAMLAAAQRAAELSREFS